MLQLVVVVRPSPPVVASARPPAWPPAAWRSLLPLCPSTSPSSPASVSSSSHGGAVSVSTCPVRLVPVTGAALIVTGAALIVTGAALHTYFTRGNSNSNFCTNFEIFFFWWKSILSWAHDRKLIVFPSLTHLCLKTANWAHVYASSCIVCHTDFSWLWVKRCVGGGNLAGRCVWGGGRASGWSGCALGNKLPTTT